MFGRLIKVILLKRTKLFIMEKKTINRQEQAGRLVSREIYHNLCLTAEKELKDNPELLLEAKNYYPQDEDGKRDDDEGEYPEIFEYWAVSEWLADDLEKQGEVVFEMLDFIVWGRQCTGQAIALDGIIQKIAQEYNF